MDLNLRVLIEPRGFIRVIQLLMSIFAFATTSGFDATSSFDIACQSWKKTIHYKFEYPFKMSSTFLRVPVQCEVSVENISIETKSFPFDFSGNAEFFVATGVLSFLYSVFICVLYVFAHGLYSTNPVTPIIDLGATGVLAIFWLAGSSAWSQGVSDLKYYTNPSNFFEYLDICKNPTVCKTVSSGNFASLNVSLIFGFANFLLWTSSMWFVYKETYFHLQRQSQMGPKYPSPPQDDFAPKMQYPNQQQFVQQSQLPGQQYIQQGSNFQSQPPIQHQDLGQPIGNQY